MAFIYCNLFTSPSTETAYPGSLAFVLLSWFLQCLLCPGSSCPPASVPPACASSAPNLSLQCLPHLPHLTSRPSSSLRPLTLLLDLLKCLRSLLPPALSFPETAPHSLDSPLPLRLFSLPSQDPPQSLFFFSFSLKATWGSENGRFQSQQAIAYVTLTVTSESETLPSYVTLGDGCPVPPQSRKGWEEDKATGPHPPRSSFTNTSARALSFWSQYTRPPPLPGALGADTFVLAPLRH